jgi:hypothetical protein
LENIQTKKATLPNFSIKWVWGGKYLAERRVSVKAIIYCRVTVRRTIKKGKAVPLNALGKDMQMTNQSSGYKAVMELSKYSGYEFGGIKSDWVDVVHACYLLTSS